MFLCHFSKSPVHLRPRGLAAEALLRRGPGSSSRSQAVGVSPLVLLGLRLGNGGKEPCTPFQYCLFFCSHKPPLLSHVIQNRTKITSEIFRRLVCGKVSRQIWRWPPAALSLVPPSAALPSCLVALLMTVPLFAGFIRKNLRIFTF